MSLIINCFAWQSFGIFLNLCFVWLTPDWGNQRNLISCHLWFRSKSQFWTFTPKAYLCEAGYEILSIQTRLKQTKQRRKGKTASHLYDNGLLQKENSDLVFALPQKAKFRYYWRLRSAGGQYLVIFTCNVDTHLDERHFTQQTKKNNFLQVLHPTKCFSTDYKTATPWIDWSVKLICIMS